MMDFLPYPSERQYLAYVRANHLNLFPRLLDQSQFNVRARALSYRLEQLRQSLHKKLVKELQAYLLIDSKPVPVVSYKRNKDQSDFLGSANYGVCTSRALKYYGYKLIMVATLEGVPVCYDLVPANTGCGLGHFSHAQAVLAEGLQHGRADLLLHGQGLRSFHIDRSY